MTEKAQRETPESGRQTVLIIEDNPPNLKYLELLLRKLGFEVLSAESGERGVDLLQEKSVDYMLIDISLAGGMSGIDFMKRVRRQKRFKNVPMVAVTAHAMKGHKQEFLKEGFDDYLAKPFSLDDLKEVLDRNLTRE